MKQYDYDDIKQSANCAAIASDLGLVVDRQGRCAATWRGGDNKTAVSINKDGWHDFVRGDSGSVIDLVAAVRFNGDIQQAQEWLGDKLNLKPKFDGTGRPGYKSRYDHLIEDGYHEARCYNYTDSFGNTIHQVIRMEHPDKKKEFVQRSASGKESISGIQTVLYNLPVISGSSWAVVVEGEKDADTLIRWNIPATTNSSGAGKWDDSFSETLKGKDVVIIPDNDTAGENHFRLVAAALIGKAKSVKVCRLTKVDKADVTDWITNEGGTRAQLIDSIKSAQNVTEESLKDTAGVFCVAEAKEANKNPFRNFHLVENTVGAKTKWDKEPRHIAKMIDDVHKRFLGFPRTVGSSMFDHDRDSGKIMHIRKQASLVSWISRKSGQCVDWSRGDGFLTKEEFFEGLLDEAIQYESTSSVPSWPVRDDVYYTHGKLPAPDQKHKYFWDLVDFFKPADEENRRLMAAFFIAPIFYKSGVARPAWVIDSDSGAGTGKTTLVEIVSHLYDTPPMRTNKQELKFNIVDLMKRMLSTKGRNARVLLVDNIVGSFSSPELADMISAHSLSGKPSYGRGEETRPNDVVYAITANSAKLDNDLADRSFCIIIGKPDKKTTWASEVRDYIKKNRMHVFADIVDILEKHRPFEGVSPTTRVPMFEVQVLQAVCESVDQYRTVLDTLNKARAESNVEDELAADITDMIKQKLSDMEISPIKQDVFIRSAVLDKWLAEITNHNQNNSQIIRNLAKMNMIKNVDLKVAIYPSNGPKKRRGIAWRSDATDSRDSFKPVFLIYANGSRIEKEIMSDFVPNYKVRENNQTEVIEACDSLDCFNL